MTTSLFSMQRYGLLLRVLGSEGFRLFFPLAAIHAAVWPLLWVAAFSFGLPLANGVPPAFWHVHEMIVGSFGAALIGFLTTAVPEWTDTRGLGRRSLHVLAGLWLCARLVGFVGADAAMALAAFCDLGWLFFLVAYLVRISLTKQTTRLVAFIFWLTALLITEALGRYALLFSSLDYEAARRLVHLPGIVFLGLLGVALARITVPVTNLVLDPTEHSSPFRPHPGRKSLAPGLIAILVAAEAAGGSPQVGGFLSIAAGAAFMDRVAESFVGRAFFRAEILALVGANAFAGLGLTLVGASRLGYPVPAQAGLHLAFMGGLGLGVLAVFAIAGLRHTGQALGLVRSTRLAFVLLTVAVALRAVPEALPTTVLPAPPYFLVSLFWAGAFLLWLRTYWPAFTTATESNPEGC